MRLLVSVRSAEEVGEALAGGADIIDAKEPSRGGLGAVDAETLGAIARRLPAAIPLSVALGDFMDRWQVEREVGRLTVGRTDGELFLKLGFAGLEDGAVAGELIAAAVGAASSFERPATIVAVAYADWSRVRAPSPDTVGRAALAGGARGVLLDTSIKDGGDLFHWMTISAVGSWVEEARAAGLLTAVAGSLGVEGIALLRDIDPDVAGVRGTACDGGRLGRVSAARVRALRSALTAKRPDGRLDLSPPMEIGVGRQLNRD